MDSLDSFLAHYRDELLERLNGVESGKRPASTFSDALQFVEEVIDAWERLPRKERRSRVRPWERTFWYALYQMEELSEFPRTSDEKLHPFEGMLLKELALARQLLEARADLPRGKFASRPDGR
ncbi:MAG TPA: hypothetical protein VIL28_14645 [Steroidobacteraceae bacterium]